MVFKARIKQLNQQISSANETNRGKAHEYNMACANNIEYAHMSQAEREQLMKKDLQIKLLKDRIS